MQYKFFEKQMDRLKQVYSSSSLNEERTKVLWERFKNTQEPVFENAINFLIGEFTTMALPGLSRFEDAVSRSKPGGSLEPFSFRENSIKYNCEACRDFGYGWVENKIEKCSCSAGKPLSIDDLQRVQNSFDAGRRLFEMAKIRKTKIIFSKELPYDQSERLSVDTF